MGARAGSSGKQRLGKGVGFHGKTRPPPHLSELTSRLGNEEGERHYHLPGEATFCGLSEWFLWPTRSPAYHEQSLLPREVFLLEPRQDGVLEGLPQQDLNT